MGLNVSSRVELQTLSMQREDLQVRRRGHEEILWYSGDNKQGLEGGSTIVDL